MQPGAGLRAGAAMAVRCGNRPIGGGGQKYPHLRTSPPASTRTSLATPAPPPAPSGDPRAAGAARESTAARRSRAQPGATWRSGAQHGAARRSRAQHGAATARSRAQHAQHAQHAQQGATLPAASSGSKLRDRRPRPPLPLNYPRSPLPDSARATLSAAHRGARAAPAGAGCPDGPVPPGWAGAAPVALRAEARRAGRDHVEARLARPQARRGWPGGAAPEAARSCGGVRGPARPLLRADCAGSD